MANILGFNIINYSKKEYISRIVEKYRNNEKLIITSGNPEILYSAIKTKEVADACNHSDIIPDGIGVILAAKITGQYIKEKIAGIEIVEEILKLSAANDIKIYMLGAQQNVVENAVKASKLKYGANIVGFHNGYFNIDDCDSLIEDINKSGAKILFVAMGCPRQEVFIMNYFEQLHCNIYMGVGGSFDVIAGKVNRAPRWMINIGLEWLYRVLKEPERIKRLKCIPKFLFEAYTYKIKNT